MTLEELETVRLVDLLDLDQEEAAFYMGISRKAFWNDLMNARKKIAAALVYGMGLRIEGGSFALRGGEGSADRGSGPQKEMELMERELGTSDRDWSSLAPRLLFKGLNKTNSDAG